MEGLNIELQEKLSSVRYYTFEDAVDRANALYSIQTRKEQVRGRFKRKGDGSSKQSESNNKKFKSGERGDRTNQDSGPCPNCKKYHPGRKYSGKPMTCYKCGKLGHTQKECGSGVTSRAG